MEVVKYHKALIKTSLIEHNLPEHCPLYQLDVDRSGPSYQGRLPSFGKKYQSDASDKKTKNLGSMFQQELHDVVVGLVGGEMEGGEELFVLIVQVAPLPVIDIEVSICREKTGRDLRMGVQLVTDLQSVSARDFLLGKGEATAQWRAESPVYGCLKLITCVKL